MRISSLVVVVILSVANIASADVFGTGDNQFTIDFVNISGDASSANGTNISQYSPGEDYYRTFTDPDNDYRMGTYEVTNDQWDKFVSSVGGTVTGYPSYAYDQSPRSGHANAPTHWASWYEAAQFANWLNTSTGHQGAYKFTGTQGTYAYVLGVWESGDAGYNVGNPYRNSNAYYFLPTEDEWVKAAYWNGTSLQTYATPDDTLPVEDVEANYHYDPVGESWDVGSGSEELNGTFDMMGNILEWMEGPYNSGGYSPGSYRGTRGGSYYFYENLSSSYRYGNSLHYQVPFAGFRVGSVPEPTTLLLLGLGGLMLRRKYRR